MEYESTNRIESECHPGVWYTIVRMSFGRRIELLRRIRELAGKIEFLEAGSDPREKIEAALLSREVEQLYLLWGLVGIEGLAVDGQPATPESLAEAGPEKLCKEIVRRIKAQTGLTEEERKN